MTVVARRELINRLKNNSSKTVKPTKEDDVRYKPHSTTVKTDAQKLEAQGFIKEGNTYYKEEQYKKAKYYTKLGQDNYRIDKEVYDTYKPIVHYVDNKGNITKTVITAVKTSRADREGKSRYIIKETYTKKITTPSSVVKYSRVGGGSNDVYKKVEIDYNKGTKTRFENPREVKAKEEQIKAEQEANKTQLDILREITEKQNPKAVEQAKSLDGSKVYFTTSKEIERYKKEVAEYNRLNKPVSFSTSFDRGKGSTVPTYFVEAYNPENLELNITGETGSNITVNKTTEFKPNFTPLYSTSKINEIIKQSSFTPKENIGSTEVKTSTGQNITKQPSFNNKISEVESAKNRLKLTQDKKDYYIKRANESSYYNWYDVRRYSPIVDKYQTKVFETSEFFAKGGLVASQKGNKAVSFSAFAYSSLIEGTAGKPLRTTGLVLASTFAGGYVGYLSTAPKVTAYSGLGYKAFKTASIVGGTYYGVKTTVDFINTPTWVERGVKTGEFTAKALPIYAGFKTGYSLTTKPTISTVEGRYYKGRVLKRQGMTSQENELLNPDYFNKKGFTQLKYNYKFPFREQVNVNIRLRGQEFFKTETFDNYRIETKQFNGKATRTAFKNNKVTLKQDIAVYNFNDVLSVDNYIKINSQLKEPYKVETKQGTRLYQSSKTGGDFELRGKNIIGSGRQRVYTTQTDKTGVSRLFDIETTGETISVFKDTGITKRTVISSNYADKIKTTPVDIEIGATRQVLPKTETINTGTFKENLIDLSQKLRFNPDLKTVTGTKEVTSFSFNFVPKENTGVYSSFWKMNNKGQASLTFQKPTVTTTSLSVTPPEVNYLNIPSTQSFYIYSPSTEFLSSSLVGASLMRDSKAEISIKQTPSMNLRVDSPTMSATSNIIKTVPVTSLKTATTTKTTTVTKAVTTTGGTGGGIVTPPITPPFIPPPPPPIFEPEFITFKQIKPKIKASKIKPLKMAFKYTPDLYSVVGRVTAPIKEIKPKSKRTGLFIRPIPIKFQNRLDKQIKNIGGLFK